MPRHTRPTYTALLPVLLLVFLLLSGCRKEPQPAQATPDLPEAGSGVYVSITVTADGGFGPSSSRTGVPGTRVPNPGEDGDGEQPGTGDENMVHDINVFFLTGSFPDGGSILDDNDARIVASEYFSGDDIRPSASGEITLYTVQREIEGLSVGGQYHALAIVNAGVDLGTRDTDPVETVTDLQDLTFSEVINTVTEGSEIHRKFLMASADDSGLIEIEPNNSPYNPTVVRIGVERMAARVDCRWENVYSIGRDNGPSQQRDNVKVLGAAIVNRYAGDTYTFKRVTSGLGIDREILYLGKEIVDINDVACNYVIDPWTFFGDGKRNSLYNYYYPEYVNWNDNDFVHDASLTAKSYDVNGNKYDCWGYVKENINIINPADGKDVEHCATGIMFKAQYTPVGFSEGVTFYVYNGSGNRIIYNEEKLRNDFPGMFGNNAVSTWGDIEGCEVYENGWCYYIYWIRHADDKNPGDIGPMEYAIVRNNIYQLYITSIGSLGTDEPDSNVDEFEGEIHLEVQNWKNVEVEVPAFD